jgi:hypothetical protein
MWFRKWTILVHRYLGIGLSLLFVIWFISGIGMIYAGGMPELTPELRLERMPPLDIARIRLSPSEAAARAALPGAPERVVLLTVMDRPAYRLYAGQLVTVFADTGDLLDNVDQAGIMAIASRFTNLPIARLHHLRVLDSADQWTIAERGQMPLHKIAADDAAHTELYISPLVGEVVVHTTRASRALAWAAAIPHWLYFAPLRVKDGLWRQVVLWTSGTGVILALAGIILGIIQFSPSRPPGQGRRARSWIPYGGWMRWHYVTGVVFGVFTLTWVFSGLLSMEPWSWVNRGGSRAQLRQALMGGPLDPTQFPPIDPAAWNQVLPAHDAKEVELLRIQGNPYYAVRGTDPRPLLLEARPLRPRREPFSIESVMGRVRQAHADRTIVESRLLSGYDAYYYDRRRPPLPVLRVKFDDPDRTWVYIDPAMSRLVAQLTRQERVERWLYHGFHSLDFAFWYYNRPLWDIGVIALSLGGTVSSAIGMFVGYRRLARHVNIF